MNASIRTLIISAALSGLLGGTPARIQAQENRSARILSFAELAAQQVPASARDQADKETGSPIARPLSFIELAAQQVSRNNEEVPMYAAPTQHTLSFVELAAQQVPGHDMASEKPLTQARMMR